MGDPKSLLEQKLSWSFVETGVKQGCPLSSFLFLLAIDWVMRETTEGERNGIQWTMWEQLKDLEFADDIVLLSHSFLLSHRHKSKRRLTNFHKLQ